jgi:hypothetical protein
MAVNLAHLMWLMAGRSSGEAWSQQSQAGENKRAREDKLFDLHRYHLTVGNRNEKDIADYVECAVRLSVA